MKNETPFLTVPSRFSLRKHAFYAILALVSLLGLGTTQSARAFTVTMQQVGANVVATGSGAFDLTGLTFQFSSTAINGSVIVPLLGIIGMGPSTAPVDLYNGYTGPTSFGSGGFTFADAASGDFVALQGLVGGLLFLPQGYVSGAALSDSLTFNNQTFATLGVMPGAYVWTWGDGGANQNFTLQIGPASVPDTGTTLPLLGFALAGLGILRRKLRC